jgi:hypothetical protein
VRRVRVERLCGRLDALARAPVVEAEPRAVTLARPGGERLLGGNIAAVGVDDEETAKALAVQRVEHLDDRGDEGLEPQRHRAGIRRGARRDAERHRRVFVGRTTRS